MKHSGEKAMDNRTTAEQEIINYYNAYDEDGRLFRDYSHQVEWLTTLHYFDKLFPSHSRIFDGCAGTGNYAFELAGKGHSVTASDIVPHNVDIMRQKQEKTPVLEDIFVGDMCEPNHCAAHSFDIVLCMGAFYHLDEKKRRKAMEQALRLLKKDGLLVVSYISLAAALYLNLAPDLTNMDEILDGYRTRAFGGPFIYMTPDEMEALKILCHITSDGSPAMRNAAFNRARKEDFEKYMELHLKLCENADLLGYGLHGLVFLRSETAS